MTIHRVWPVGQAVLPGQPGYGPTHGRQLVEVAGGGFPIYPTQVRLLFGGREAEDVRVVRTSRIRAATPPSPIPVSFNASGEIVEDATGLVNVRVEVLDDDGVLVPGEFDVLAGGYEYRREPLDDDNPDVLDTIYASLIAQLRRDFTPVVVPGTRSIDYVDPDARTPYVTLVEPTLVEPSRADLRDGVVVDGATLMLHPISGRALLSRSSVRDLLVGVEVYVSERDGGMPAIQRLESKLVRLVENDRPYLDVRCDLTDPLSPVLARLDLRLERGAVVVPRAVANDSGLYWFTAQIRVLGVVLRGGTFAGMGVSDRVTLVRSVGVILASC